MENTFLAFVYGYIFGTAPINFKRLKMHKTKKKQWHSVSYYQEYLEKISPAHHKALFEICKQIEKDYSHLPDDHLKIFGYLVAKNIYWDWQHVFSFYQSEYKKKISPMVMVAKAKKWSLIYDEEKTDICLLLAGVETEEIYKEMLPSKPKDLFTVRGTPEHICVNLNSVNFKVSEKEIKKLSRKIRPLARFSREKKWDKLKRDDDGILYFIRKVDPMRTAFTWGPIPTRPAKSINPEPYRAIITAHPYGAPVFFKPTIEEVLAQISEEDRKKCVGYETRHLGFTYFRKNHSAITYLYARAD